MLPQHVREKIQQLPVSVQEVLEEIRLRRGFPVEIVSGGHSSFVTERGGLTKNPRDGWLFSESSADLLLNLISQHSLYALEEELRRGYVTVTGGHRVGISGKALTEKGEVRGMKDISSFNIRIAREKKGVAIPILPFLISEGNVLNTLIVSPPQCGKTTLLRDLARIISYGNPHLSGKKVAIVDERSEIAGCVRGVPQKDVGVRTDVLDACPKAEGMMMMVRSMSPDVLITDEIGRREDAEAVQEVINSGVVLLASAHGRDIEEIKRRPVLSAILQMNVFRRYVVLSRRQGAGTVESIFDENLSCLLKEAAPC